MSRVCHDQEVHGEQKLGLVTIYEAKSAKDSNMDQEDDICNRVYEIATYNMRRVHVTIKKKNVNKPRYTQIRLFTAKEIEAIKQNAYVNYSSERIQRTVSIILSFYVC